MKGHEKERKEKNRLKEVEKKRKIKRKTGKEEKCKNRSKEKKGLKKSIGLFFASRVRND